MQLPKGFLLGAALAGHQVEGNNTDSNWWQAELQGKVPSSGLGADHYHQFDSDFVLAKELGLNAVRISIEWSRIEPREGQWNAEAIAHYHEVFASLQKQGLTPMVTLFHWTLPQWLARKGGLETQFGVQAFAKFIEVIAHEYGHKANLWLTLNEPEVFAFEGYYTAKHVPFRTNLFLALKVYYNLICAHKLAYRILKQVNPSAQVGVAKNVAYNEPFRPNHIFDRLIVKVANKIGNEFFIDRIRKQLDFIGLNYYFTHTVKSKWYFGFEAMNIKHPKSAMGITTYPRGLYFLLKRFSKYRKPIYITENGIANANDEMRGEFIAQHLHAVDEAIRAGVNVKGYFNWALIDTYEWQKGYDLKFGLAEVNYHTLKRTLRLPAKFFNQFRDS